MSAKLGSCIFRHDTRLVVRFRNKVYLASFDMYSALEPHPMLLGYGAHFSKSLSAALSWAATSAMTARAYFSARSIASAFRGLTASSIGLAVLVMVKGYLYRETLQVTKVTSLSRYQPDNGPWSVHYPPTTYPYKIVGFAKPNGCRPVFLHNLQLTRNPYPTYISKMPCELLATSAST